MIFDQNFDFSFPTKISNAFKTHIVLGHTGIHASDDEYIEENEEERDLILPLNSLAGEQKMGSFSRLDPKHPGKDAVYSFTYGMQEYETFEEIDRLRLAAKSEMENRCGQDGRRADNFLAWLHFALYLCCMIGFVVQNAYNVLEKLTTYATNPLGTTDGMLSLMIVTLLLYGVEEK